jgi:hypothetical protein
MALRPGGPIRSSPVHRLLAPTRGNIAAWHDLHRLQNRAIPHLVCSNIPEVSLNKIDFGTLLSPGCVCTSMLAHRPPSLTSGADGGGHDCCLDSLSRAFPSAILEGGGRMICRGLSFEVRSGLLPWTRRDLNPRPPRCKRGALPAELRARTPQRPGSGFGPRPEAAGSAPMALWYSTTARDNTFCLIGELNQDRLVPGRPAGRCAVERTNYSRTE